MRADCCVEDVTLYKDAQSSLILMFAEAQKWSWGPAQSLMKLLKIIDVNINKAEVDSNRIIILVVQMLSAFVL